MKRNADELVELERRENFVRSLEVKDLARAAVEASFDGLELGVCDGTEIGTFGQVLADEAVGVFVGSPLPWAVGIAEEDADGEPLGQGLVQGHFRALVVGKRLAQAGRDGAKPLGEALQC